MGSIHPDFVDYESEINRLRSNGIPGVKWNSLVQDFYLDDARMLRIYEAMGDDMVAYFHMGNFGAAGNYGKHDKSTPERLRSVIDTFPRLKVVAAHFGGLGMLEDAGKYLVGRNVYLDTSWSPSLDVLDPLVIARIIEEHGSDKVLFGSDFPAVEAQRQIKWLSKLPISEEDKERIFWKNANELFGLKL
ncbi:MAG: amidohydrolase family protein [Chloroflexi bacterium]|nr:amidohydrolase family protein [Chloroflexota bacterium]